MTTRQYARLDAGLQPARPAGMRAPRLPHPTPSLATSPRGPEVARQGGHTQTNGRSALVGALLPLRFTHHPFNGGPSRHPLLKNLEQGRQLLVRTDLGVGPKPQAPPRSTRMLTRARWAASDGFALARPVGSCMSPRPSVAFGAVGEVLQPKGPGGVISCVCASRGSSPREVLFRSSQSISPVSARDTQSAGVGPSSAWLGAPEARFSSKIRWVANAGHPPRVVHRSLTRLVRAAERRLSQEQLKPAPANPVRGFFLATTERLFACAIMARSLSRRAWQTSR
jgi:hypothetical protein